MEDQGIGYEFTQTRWEKIKYSFMRFIGKEVLFKMETQIHCPKNTIISINMRQKNGEETITNFLGIGEWRKIDAELPNLNNNPITVEITSPTDFMCEAFSLTEKVV
jgi:hypothetical protein